MIVKTKAIVLRTLKYGDAQLIIDTLTEDYGRVSFMQRLPRNGRGRIRKQLFQPLAVLAVAFDQRPARRLMRLTEAAMAYPLTGLTADPRKYTVAMFIAELTLACTRSEQANAPLFAFIENSVRWLDACRRPCPNFHIIYAVHLSRFIGFMPSLEGAGDGCFDLRGGCFSPTLPTHPDYLLPEEASKIALLMRLNYETMHLLSLTHDERNRIVAAVMRYYSLHLPDFPDLKSLQVLREVFA